jgi:hypothetical protein
MTDPHYFNADPDPAFHLHADPDPALQHTVIRICDHWSRDPPVLHFEPPSLDCERPRLNFFFEPLKFLNFECGSGRIHLFFFNANPDPYQLPKFNATWIRNPDRRYIRELKDRQQQSENSPFENSIAKLEEHICLTCFLYQAKRFFSLYLGRSSTYFGPVGRSSRIPDPDLDFLPILHPVSRIQEGKKQCCGTVTIFYGSGSGSGSDF